MTQREPNKVHHGAGDTVTLRMDRRVVERLCARRHAQEASGLLEGPRTHTRDLPQHLARLKGTVFITEGDDRIGNFGPNAGDIAQQRRGGGVEVRADALLTVDSTTTSRVSARVFWSTSC